MRFLRRLFGTLVALVVLFEEWGWEPLHALLVRFTRWPPLTVLERRIARLPPYGALAVYVVPALALLPVKLGALALLAHDHALAGLLLIVAAKLVGTAVLARLFALTQPALMRLAWFARLYGRWTAWKERVLAEVRASWAWRLARRARRHWAVRVRDWTRAVSRDGGP